MAPEGPRSTIRPAAPGTPARVRRARTGVRAAAAATATVVALVHGLPGAAASAPEPLSWAEAERKASGTLAKLTAREKRSMLNGKGDKVLSPGFYVGSGSGVQRLGVPLLKLHDSGNGFRTTAHYMVGTVTVWPSPLASACTWDEELVGAQAAAIGREFRGKGANVLLGPAVNVHRVSRAGRNFELLSGEDPYLGARLARAYVMGVQSQGVLAVVKHFAFNEQETNRYKVDSKVGERAAWELYYPPFQAAVDAGAGAFMCAYNKVNGTWCCENEDLLQRDLRGRMGFRGFVMSDWWAVHRTSVDKGLDMDQPGTDGHFSDKKLASVDEKLLDKAVHRVLAATYRLRLDEYPGCAPPHCVKEQQANVTSVANRALAREVATAAVTLLKNDGVLPLQASKVRTLAVIGRAAVAAPAPWGTTFPPRSGMPRGDIYAGGGSGHISARSVVTALDGISRRARTAGIRVVSSTDGVVRHAVKTAREADVAIFVAGATTVENMDRGSLRLSGPADHVIESLAKVKPTIVLLQVPGAVLTPWRHHVSAVACLFLGGEMTGHAWAAALFGDAPPSGKLPVMLPASDKDTIEPRSDEVSYGEGLFTSYRSPRLKAAFPFGHGLTYTTFAFEQPAAWLRPRGAEAGPRRLQSRPSRALGLVRTTCTAAHGCARVTVRNTGHRAGSEVAQAYLEFPDAADTPKRQLRGFRRTRLLKPGEQEDVVFPLSERDCSIYHPQHGWQLQEHVVVHLGASSADTPHSARLLPARSAEELGFPLSFEDDAEGACPRGWSCTGDVTVCSITSRRQACIHPGLHAVKGSRYLKVGNDFGTGVAASPVFTLPVGIDRVSVRLAGGAGRGSGLYVHLGSDGSVLCSAEDGLDCNRLREVSCRGLAGYDNEAVYVTLRDTASSVWGKVLMDDIRLKNAAGQDLGSGQEALLV